MIDPEHNRNQIFSEMRSEYLRTHNVSSIPQEEDTYLYKIAANMAYQDMIFSLEGNRDEVNTGQQYSYSKYSIFRPIASIYSLVRVFVLGK